MDFEKPQDYVEALKRLEGFPLMGMEVRDGSLFFTSLSSHVALHLRNKAKEWGDRVYVMAENGRAVELFFNAEEGENEDGEDD